MHETSNYLRFFLIKSFLFSLFIQIYYLILQPEIDICRFVMKTKMIDQPVRTKEEILSWLNAARQRKEVWEKKVDAKFAERLRNKNAAAESGYYDLDWV